MQLNCVVSPYRYVAIQSVFLRSRFRLVTHVFDLIQSHALYQSLNSLNPDNFKINSYLKKVVDKLDSKQRAYLGNNCI